MSVEKRELEHESRISVCKCGTAMGIKGDVMCCEKCLCERPMTEDERRRFGLLNKGGEKEREKP